MYYIYIIKGIKRGEFYTGLTRNLKERIKQHNSGSSLYTRRELYWKLVWFCVFSNKNKVALFERYLKSASGIAFRNRHLV